MDGSRPESPHERDAPERAALAGVVVNAALALVKLLAGIVGHSFALVADAVESLVDIAGSFIVWGALRYGRKPADEDHPFGHGKVEALAGLAVALLIAVAGLGIAAEAIRQIFTPHVAPASFTLFVLIAVIAIKETMYRVTRRAASAAESSAAYADAWHHRSDAITSLFAFVGISAALIGGPSWAPADDWAALLASGVIVFNGVRLAKAPYAEIMDRHSPTLAREVTEVALRVPGVLGIERCETRASGRGHRVVMHAEVDPEMTVADSHRLTGVLKSEIRGALPRVDSVLVHIEPHGPRVEPVAPARDG